MYVTIVCFHRLNKWARALDARLFELGAEFLCFGFVTVDEIKTDDDFTCGATRDRRDDDGGVVFDDCDTAAIARDI